MRAHPTEVQIHLRSFWLQLAQLTGSTGDFVVDCLANVRQCFYYDFFRILMTEPPNACRKHQIHDCSNRARSVAVDPRAFNGTRDLFCSRSISAMFRKLRFREALSNRCGTETAMLTLGIEVRWPELEEAATNG